MVGPAELARRLHELITALDRRIPRAEHPAEAAIARDAAYLREQAVTRLAEIAAAAPDADPRPGQTRTTSRTPFPVLPTDVEALTVQEFIVDLDELDEHRAPSMDRICRTFIDDANRALVWWIRFGALRAWCASPGVMSRMTSDTRILGAARRVAASFPLNQRWEFDAPDFDRAVDGIALRRPRSDAGAAPLE